MSEIEERINEKLFYIKMKYPNNSSYSDLYYLYQYRLQLHKITNCLIFLEDFKDEIFFRSIYNDLSGNITSVIQELYKNPKYKTNVNDLDQIKYYKLENINIKFIPQKTTYEDIFEFSMKNRISNLDYYNIVNDKNDIIPNIFMNNYLFFDNEDDADNCFKNIFKFYSK